MFDSFCVSIVDLITWQFDTDIIVLAIMANERKFFSRAVLVRINTLNATASLNEFRETRIGFRPRPSSVGVCGSEGSSGRACGAGPGGRGAEKGGFWGFGRKPHFGGQKPRGMHSAPGGVRPRPAGPLANKSNSGVD